MVLNGFGGVVIQFHAGTFERPRKIFTCRMTGTFYQRITGQRYEVNAEQIPYSW